MKRNSVPPAVARSSKIQIRQVSRFRWQWGVDLRGGSSMTRSGAIRAGRRVVAEYQERTRLDKLEWEDVYE